MKTRRVDLRIDFNTIQELERRGKLSEIIREAISFYLQFRNTVDTISKLDPAHKLELSYKVIK